MKVKFISDLHFDLVVRVVGMELLDCLLVQDGVVLVKPVHAG